MEDRLSQKQMVINIKKMVNVCILWREWLVGIQYKERKEDLVLFMVIVITIVILLISILEMLFKLKTLL